MLRASKAVLRRLPVRGLRHATRFPPMARAVTPHFQMQRAMFSDKTADPEVVEAEDVDDEIELEEETPAEHEVEAETVASETVSGAGEKHTFQAETRRILDIVAKSLYTDKEVFLREIISNASDALEKARYLQLANEELVESERELDINVIVNEKNNTITIQDTGIGMTKEELVENLGTIARSGSKAFAEAAQEGDASNIIGQFGVGFYSVFMVAHKVEVYSLSAKQTGNAQAHYWTSDGTGEYSISEAEGCHRGTKIIIHLNEDCKEFAIKHMIEGVVKKYSNFVGFPIYLNGNKVNTVLALWTMSPSEITDEQHVDFYRYVANAYDSPFFRMHFTTDAPIAIKSLFYFPERHMEKYGMGRSDPGVSLYCRKVLIQHKCTSILPEWLRFVKGVVDCEDIPLNISRENMQDSALLDRLKNVMTKRVIKFLNEQAKKDKEKFLKFYGEFSNFIKEGVVSDFNHKNDIATLLRFDTSLGESQLSSLDDYISRMPVDQDKIYYLCAPNRDFALNSPYYETFDKQGIEVVFCDNQIDDFVMKNLERYGKRRLVSIEAANLDIDQNKKKEELSEDDKAKKEADEQELLDYFKTTLDAQVSSVKITHRLSSSPAIVVDTESAAVRKMMRAMDSSGVPELAKQKLELNPDHPTLKKLLKLKDTKPDVAKMVAEQVFDNALIAADILDNPRTMLNRLNKILEQACE